jgi:CubicO group peptidase (beta-lactamase class C family)
MKVHLFPPFGMGSSGYVWNDKLENLMAHPHGEKGEPIKQNRATVEHVSRFGSAGELRTTPTDYARFVFEVIGPKPADAFRAFPFRLNTSIRIAMDPRITLTQSCCRRTSRVRCRSGFRAGGGS